jgi:2Fe-2S ferredoxin
MARLKVITRQGIERTVRGASDISVMEILRDEGFHEVLALCGGCCSCATCHVYVDPDPALAEALPPICDDENALLDASGHRRPGSRLSCQLRFSEALDGLSITIAPED